MNLLNILNPKQFQPQAPVSSNKAKARVARQPLISKENISKEVKGAGQELKGVALYIEEHRGELEEEGGKERVQVRELCVVFLCYFVSCFFVTL